MERYKELGQFYTPHPVAELAVRLAAQYLDKRETGIDPACGDGVFLAAMMRAGFREVWGVDIDRSVLAVIPSSVRDRAKIVIADALARGFFSEAQLPENYFDLVAGNPPFNSRYNRVADSRLQLYELGRGRQSQAPEVLFLERALQLARPGGVVALILPEGLLASKPLEYVRRYALRYRVLAVVELPRGFFRGALGTVAKTGILILKKEPNDGSPTLLLTVKDTGELGYFLEDVKRAYTHGTLAALKPDTFMPRFYRQDAATVDFREGLEVRQLGELVAGARRGMRLHKEDLDAGEKSPRFISLRNITPYGIDMTRDDKRVKPGSRMDKPSAYARPGDLLVVRSGRGIVGRAAVAVDERDRGIVNDWTYIIECRDRELMPYYLAIFLQTQLGKTQVLAATRGVAVLDLPLSELYAVKVPVPPGDLLRQVKSQYLEMVSSLRNGDRSRAASIHGSLLRLVENAIKPSAQSTI